MCSAHTAVKTYRDYPSNSNSLTCLHCDIKLSLKVYYAAIMFPLKVYYAAIIICIAIMLLL